MLECDGTWDEGAITDDIGSNEQISRVSKPGVRTQEAKVEGKQSYLGHANREGHYNANRKLQLLDTRISVKIRADLLNKFLISLA